MDAPDAVALRDRGEHVEARDHPAEHRVGAVEVRLGRVGDEELAAACVGPRERHTHGTHLVAGGIHLVAQHESRSAPPVAPRVADRKSTRLNSSHLVISYAVFCLKKKKEGLLSCPSSECQREAKECVCAW